MNAELDALSRPALLDQARRLGVERPERLTRVELRDEIIRRQAPEGDLDARGLFGVARSMLASVVEAGLKMPDAARAIRGEASMDFPTVTRSPVATVTLAEIYAAQGHPGRARRMLEEVLKDEPDHDEALRVLEGLSSSGGEARAKSEEMSTLAVSAASREPEPLTEGEAAEHAALASDPRYVETTGETLESGPLPPVAPVDAAPVEAAPREHEPSEPVLFVAGTSGALRLYFELPRASLESCGVDPSHGHAAVRLVGFEPRGDRPERRDVTRPVEGTRGRLEVTDFADSAVVRAALGWVTGEDFLPFTVARALSTDALGDVELRAARALGT